MTPTRALAATAAAGLGTFAALAALVFSGVLLPLDAAASAGVHDAMTQSRTAVDVFRLLTQLGNRYVLAAVALAVTLGFGVWGKDWRSAGLVAAVAVAYPLLNELFKHLFHRPRPAWTDPFVVETGFSFPSGHAMGSMMIYGLLAVLAARRLTGWRRSAAVAGLAALILLVGASRVILGVHYPADVLAGYALGLAAVATALAVAAKPA